MSNLEKKLVLQKPKNTDMTVHRGVVASKQLSDSATLQQRYEAVAHTGMQQLRQTEYQYVQFGKDWLLTFLRDFTQNKIARLFVLSPHTVHNNVLKTVLNLSDQAMRNAYFAHGWPVKTDTGSLGLCLRVVPSQLSDIDNPYMAVSVIARNSASQQAQVAYTGNCSGSKLNGFDDVNHAPGVLHALKYSGAGHAKPVTLQDAAHQHGLQQPVVHKRVEQAQVAGALTPLPETTILYSPKVFGPLYQAIETGHPASAVDAATFAGISYVLTFSEIVGSDLPRFADEVDNANAGRQVVLKAPKQ